MRDTGSESTEDQLKTDIAVIDDQRLEMDDSNQLPSGTVDNWHCSSVVNKACNPKAKAWTPKAKAKAWIPKAKAK